MRDDGARIYRPDYVWANLKRMKFYLEEMSHVDAIPEIFE
jgi:hypothetical protein